MPELKDALQIVDEVRGGRPPRKYRPHKLNFDQDELIKTVLDEMKRAEDARMVWMENHTRWLAKYLGQIEQNPEGGYSIHLPILMSHVQRLTAGTSGAVFSGGRVLRARARSRAGMDMEDHVTEFLNYQLLVELGFEKVTEALALDFFVHGKFIAKVPWMARKENVREVEHYPAEASDEEILLDLYPELPAVKSGDYSYKIERPSEGAADPDVKVTDHVELYPTANEIRAVITKEVVTWHNPKVIRKNLEDVVVPNPDTLRNILDAAWIIDKTWMTGDEIRRLAKDKVYDLLTKEDLEQIEEWESVEHGGTSAPGQRGTQDVSAAQQGVDPMEDKTGTKTGLTMLECYWHWDVDGDGFNERVVFWIIEELKLLARARYLSEVYRDNEWPYAEAGFIPTEGFYAMGVPEFAEGIQDAIVILHNQGLEWGAITNAPVGFYRPSSALKPETIRYRAGELIPVDSPRDDIVFPSWPTANQTWRFNEEALLNQYLDRGLAQGPVQFGQPPEGRASAVRTARATMALIGQGDMLADLTLARFQHGLNRIFKLVWRRDREFLPPGRSFRVVGPVDPGQDPFREIPDREALQGDYDFEFVSNNQTASRDYVRQAMMLVMQTVVNPLTLQTGIVTPTHLYQMYKELLISLERRDFDKFIQKPPQFLEPPKDPLLEHDMMIHGQPARVSPMENLQEHMQAHMAFVMSPAFAMVPPVYIGLFKSHIEETMQAMQSMMQATQGVPEAAAGAQQQMAANPMMQSAIEGRFGSSMGPMMGMGPAPGALGPGGRAGEGGGSPSQGGGKK